MAQTIIVDISTRGANPVAYTHQGDTGRTFFAEIYENGEAFAVAGYTIKVGAILPADRGYYVIAGNDMVTATKTTDGTNKIYFTLSENYSLKAGNGILTLIFTSNTGTPSTIRPINIDLRIQKSADADDTIAGASDFPEGLESIAESVFQEYLSTYLPPVAPSSSAAANKAADAKLTGEALDDLKSDLNYTLNGIDRDFVGTAPSGGSWLKAITGGFFVGQKFTITNNGTVQSIFSFRLNDETLVNNITVPVGETKVLTLTAVPDYMNIYVGANNPINVHIKTSPVLSEELITVPPIVDKLQSACFETGTFSGSLFERGGLYYNPSAGTVIKTSEVSRIRTASLMHTHPEMTLTVADGYKFGVTLYTESGTPISDSGWQTLSYIVPNDSYYKIVITKNPEQSGVSADISEFASKLTYEYCVSVKEDLEDIKNGITVTTPNQKFSSADFELGGLYYNPSAGTVTPTGEKTRIRANKLLHFPYSIMICLPNGWTMGIQKYTSDGTIISDSGWINGEAYREIEKDSFFKLVIRKNPEGTATANISEYANILTYSYSLTVSESAKLLDERVDAIEESISLENVAYKYAGETVSFKKRGFNVQQLYSVFQSPQGAGYQQGFAIYDGVLFQLYANDKVILADLETGSIITTLDIKSDHGDTIDFSNEFYSASDEFPLAYITSDTTPCKVYVVRITRTGTTLIRTLYFGDIEKTGYYAGHCLDVDSNALYLVGYKANSYYEAENNEMIISRWNLMSLTTNGDETQTPEFVSSFNIPFIRCVQGQRYFSNKIWLLSSHNGLGGYPVNTCIYAVDFERKKIVTSMSDFPSSIKNTECEALEFVLVDDERYDVILSNTAYYQLTFN